MIACIYLLQFDFYYHIYTHIKQQFDYYSFYQNTVFFNNILLYL